MPLKIMHYSHFFALTGNTGYDLLKPLCTGTLVPINLGTSSAELIYKINWSRIFVYDNLAWYRYYFKVESNALQTPTTVPFSTVTYIQKSEPNDEKLASTF